MKIKGIEIKSTKNEKIDFNEISDSANIKVSRNFYKALTNDQLSFSLIGLALYEANQLKGYFEASEFIKKTNLISQRKAERTKLLNEEISKILDKMNIPCYLDNENNKVFGFVFSYIHFKGGRIYFRINEPICELLLEDEKYVCYNLNELRTKNQINHNMRGTTSPDFLYKELKTGLNFPFFKNGFMNSGFTKIIKKEDVEKNGMNWKNFKVKKRLFKLLEQIEKTERIEIKKVEILVDKIIFTGYLKKVNKLTATELKRGAKWRYHFKDLNNKFNDVFELYTSDNDSKALTNRKVINLDNEKSFLPFPWLGFKNSSSIALDLENYNEELLNYLEKNNLLWEFSQSGNGVHIIVKNTFGLDSSHIGIFVKFEGIASEFYGDIRMTNSSNSKTMIKIGTGFELDQELKEVAATIRVASTNERKSRQEERKEKKSTSSNFSRYKTGNDIIASGFTVNQIKNNEVPEGSRNMCFSLLRKNRVNSDTNFFDWIKELEGFEHNIEKDTLSNLKDKRFYK